MMSAREPLEWHFKQLDHDMGLSFQTNFNFALVGHLLKGLRHPAPTTVSRTIRVLHQLLSITVKPTNRDKFEVTSQTVAYLAALVSVSEEVRSRCHLKHRTPNYLSDSPSSESVSSDMASQGQSPSPSLPTSASTSGVSTPITHPNPPQALLLPQTRRQKSLDVLDQNALAVARQQQQQQ
ncbi:neurofibromin-like, partial [Aplysia californica]|uniref:Neurofibromin-like n=1 Tax=Aplysia californica TaxID=6500 RepID=A0ABM1VV40_APLCA